MKHIFQPSVLKRNRSYGFRVHMANKNGRRVLVRHCARGRSRLAASK